MTTVLHDSGGGYSGGRAAAPLPGTRTPIEASSVCASPDGRRRACLPR